MSYNWGCATDNDTKYEKVCIKEQSKIIGWKHSNISITDVSICTWGNYAQLNVLWTVNSQLYIGSLNNCSGNGCGNSIGDVTNEQELFRLKDEWKLADGSYSSALGVTFGGVVASGCRALDTTNNVVVNIIGCQGTYRIRDGSKFYIAAINSPPSAQSGGSLYLPGNGDVNSYSGDVKFNYILQ